MIAAIYARRAPSRTEELMLTKLAGVFLQLLGAAGIIVGLGMLASREPGLSGVVMAFLGAGLLWLGRQTHSRNGSR